MEIVNSIPKSKSDLLLEDWGFNLTGEYLQIISSAALNKELPVFEIATGSGRAVSVLTRLGYKVITGDSDLSKINEAEARITLPFLADVSFLKLNIEKLSFPNDSIESIVCLNTMHELDNPVKGLSELIRVINPTGIFLLADFTPLGFDVMDRLHLYRYNELHPRGKVKFDELKIIINKAFDTVEEFKTDLNYAIVAKNKIKK